MVSDTLDEPGGAIVVMVRLLPVLNIVASTTLKDALADPDPIPTAGEMEEPVAKVTLLEGEFNIMASDDCVDIWEAAVIVMYEVTGGVQLQDTTAELCDDVDMMPLEISEVSGTGICKDRDVVECILFGLVDETGTGACEDKGTLVCIPFECMSVTGTRLVVT